MENKMSKLINMDNAKRDLLTYKKKELATEIIKQRGYVCELTTENKKLKQRVNDLELQVESLKSAMHLSNDELKALAESKKNEAKLTDTLNFMVKLSGLLY